MKFASNDLKADKEIAMMTTVKNDGSTFQFVSEELKADADMIAAAMKGSTGFGECNYTYI